MGLFCFEVLTLFYFTECSYGPIFLKRCIGMGTGTKTSLHIFFPACDYFLSFEIYTGLFWGILRFYDPTKSARVAKFLGIFFGVGTETK